MRGEVGYPRRLVSEELPTLDESKDTSAEGEPASPDVADSKGSRQARRRAHQRRNAIEWIVVLAGALIIAIVIKTFLFQAFYIPSDSMEPTLKVGDRVLVNKLSYRLHDVNHGDIVVFDRPSTTGQTVDGCDGGQVTIPPSASFSAEEVHDLIKRVIATGGDTVEQREGSIYVNGKKLDEPYVHKTNGVTDKTPSFRFSAQCIKVPEGKVFVLGDNRQDSNASNMFGPIPESSIVGRAFIRVWPLGSIGGV
jgi:signal peptidase I